MTEYSEDSGHFLFTRPAAEEGRTVEQAALDAFGRLLMARVRDAAITDWDTIVAGGATSPYEQRSRELLSLFDDQQIEALRELIPQIVDSTLHHLLWTLEQVKWITVKVDTDAGTIPNLSEASDGLAGEKYYWIPRFSKQRFDKTFYDE